MNNPPKDSILVIDDNKLTLELISEILQMSGYRVHLAESGEEGLRRFFDQRPNLVLLDLVLPGIDGYETCERILSLTDAPIIFLTVENDEDAIVRGLDLGAVDYITKPFSNRILLARIKLALRHIPAISQVKGEAAYDDGNLKIDLKERRVFIDGQSLKLTATEYALLTYLFENAGAVLTFAQILDHVWGWGEGDRTNVYTYVRRLRRKLEPETGAPNYIMAEHGVGYRFEKRD